MGKTGIKRRAAGILQVKGGSPTYPISSSLTSQVQEFDKVRAAVAKYGFTLGGNWDYQQGSFDCALDEANQVWLRLPFVVTIGHLDSETDETDAKIRLGEPYVLKHVYFEGLDPDTDASPRTMAAMVNQFSPPKNPDADIEPRWVDDAKRKLRLVEAMYPG